MSRLRALVVGGVAVAGMVLGAAAAAAEPAYGPEWSPNQYGPEWDPNRYGPEWDPNNAQPGTADILEGLFGWLH